MRIDSLPLPLAASLMATAISACFCGPPPVATQTFGFTEVTVDGDADRITVTNTAGGARRVLLDIPASRIGTKDGDAFYDMQFGMFDIQEDTTPYGFVAPDLVVTNVFGGDVEAGRSIVFELRDADGNVHVTGNVRSERVTDAVIELTAANAAHDRVFAASSCPLAHAVGFGAQTHDVDHKGQVIPSWVSEQGIGKLDTDELPTVWQVVGRRHTSHAPLPAFVTDRAAAYVVDTSAFARTSVCADGLAYSGALFDAARGAPTTDELAFEVFEGTLTVRVFAGDTPRAAQALMSDHFGRPPLVPPWALAPWNDAIFGTDSVRAFAERIRELDIPSSAIWSEDWRGGREVGGGLYRLDEDWRLDEVLYPGFAELVEDVNALGFQELVYFNTFVTQGGDVFDEITEGGLAIDAPLFDGADAEFSPTTLLDLTNPEAREYVKEQHLKPALALGTRGWMADFAEWLPVENTTLASGEEPALAHNEYAVLWQQVNQEALAEAGLQEGDDAAVVFARSAWLGSQPFTQVMWAGDQRTSFDADDGLPTIIPIGVGLATVGFPVVTHDVAGYQSSTNDPVDTELFQRWASLGAFSPVMRTHHGTHALLNVQVLSNETTTAHWKRYAELHIQLYPYLRRLAIDAVAPGGAPMWLPMPLVFPEDEATWGLLDQVMLGPSLLVAPVVEKGAQARDVVFPSARFTRFPGMRVGTPEAFDGPTTLEVTADFSEIPVFVVAGGIVPMTSEPADTLLPDPDGDGPLTGIESTRGDRTVVIALGADGTFVEEDGATYTLEGTGTNAPDGDVLVTGNDVYVGDGYTITLTGHPDDRSTLLVIQ